MVIVATSRIVRYRNSEDGDQTRGNRILTSNNCAGEAITAIKADTVTTSGTVNLNLSGIRRELLRWVLGCDSALNSETPCGNAVLSQTKLGQRSTGSNLDLGSNDIDTSNLLSDGMLDLDSGVDLDKVVSVLLVDQELGGTSVAVVDRLRELDGIVEEGLADIRGKILGWGKLNDLLMSALDGAVTLVQVDDVAVVVSEELDLNVLGLVEEALDEDGAVAEGGLGLGGGAIKGLLESLLLADDTHTAATATVGGLDDDGEAVFVGELLDILELLDSALGTGDDWDAGLDGKGSGRDLISERVDDLGRWADELNSHVSDWELVKSSTTTYDKASLLNIASKLGILGKETVAWMDHVDAVL